MLTRPVIFASRFATLKKAMKSPESKIDFKPEG